MPARIKSPLLAELSFNGCSRAHVPLSLLYAHQQARCFYCKGYIKYAAHTAAVNGYSIDHLFPRSLGFGKGGNVVLACRPCNERKANRLPTFKEIARASVLYATMGRIFVVSDTVIVQ